MVSSYSFTADPESNATLNSLTGTISQLVPIWPVLSHFLVCEHASGIYRLGGGHPNSTWFVFPGNGDILSYEDAMKAKETGVSGIMIAR